MMAAERALEVTELNKRYLTRSAYDRREFRRNHPLGIFDWRRKL
jgi:hypothetical protein